MKAGQFQAFARLANFGPENVSVLVKLFLNEGPEAINADRLEIPAGESRGVAFDLGGLETGTCCGWRLPTATRWAWTTGPAPCSSAPRRARVLLVTSGNEPLVEALTTKAAAELAEIRVEPPDFLKTRPYADQAEAGAWDLVVYDGLRPRQMPRANTFFIGDIPPAGGWAVRPEVAVPADHRRGSVPSAVAMDRSGRHSLAGRRDAAGRAGRRPRAGRFGRRARCWPWLPVRRLRTSSWGSSCWTNGLAQRANPGDSSTPTGLCGSVSPRSC